MKINCVVAGYGYWGPKLARNLRRHTDCGNIDLCETNLGKGINGREEFPSSRLFREYDRALETEDIHAVLIATPVASHYPMAKKALLAGKHVLVEKPLALTLREAGELTDLADSRGLVLMTDHTFVYHPAVRKIKELVEIGEIGKLHYIDSVRINLGIIQQDVNVLWDLAVHDLSIVNFLTDERPRTVQAVGVSHTRNGIENIGHLMLNYESGLFVHVNCSWVSPVKIRHTLIGGDKKMILYDDLNPSEPVKLYDATYHPKSEQDMERLLYECRSGDVTSPRVEQREALEGVVDDFLSCIIKRRQPISDGHFACDIIRLLESAQRSIKRQGEPINILEPAGSTCAT
ncbi:MAG: Gfo/Idh/MocA family oxidoreductase [Candidatus Omnitrophota bacterium]|nr:Gfo/Idh/MocA family oxidoreductase [Candidatus Omnitrophota bacterium]